MTNPVEICDESEYQALDAFLVERIYQFNAAATGFFDAQLLAGRIRNEDGEIIAAFNGHTWGGCCVIAHLWVHEAQRKRGLGKAILQAAEAEAIRRRCEQVVLSTHSFQASKFYERLGYDRRAEIDGWPKGHSEIIYVKALAPRSAEG